MTVSVDYDNRHNWLSARTFSSNRAYSNATVRYGSSNPAAVTLWSLIDTGADYLCLSDQVAAQLGVNLNNCTRFVNGVTPLGSKPNIPIETVNLEMEGYNANVDAIFDIAFRKVSPLVGRVALLRVIKFGIDSTGWLYAQK
jgi:predicted aspartyl protease